MILKTILKRITVLFLEYVDSAHLFNSHISHPLCSKSDGNSICECILAFFTDVTPLNHKNRDYGNTRKRKFLERHTII